MPKHKKFIGTTHCSLTKISLMILAGGRGDSHADRHEDISAAAMTLAADAEPVLKYLALLSVSFI